MRLNLNIFMTSVDKSKTSISIKLNNQLQFWSFEPDHKGSDNIDKHHISISIRGQYANKLL